MSEPQPQESGLSAPEPQSAQPQPWAQAVQTADQAADQTQVSAQVPAQSTPPDAQPLVPSQYAPQGFQPAPRPGAAAATGFTAAERFWYILGCLAYGANYFAKVCSKKALSDFGLAALNDTEGAWYTILCIACGLGYFMKIPTAKAISEMPQFASAGPAPAVGPAS